MKWVWSKTRELAARVWENPKLRKRLIWSVTIFVILQIYFVRELIAAELLFGIAFAILLLLSAIFYVVGALGERGLDWAEAGLRVAADSARRGYDAVSELSKKSVRHPHSESVP